MQTELSAAFRDHPDGAQAEAILRKCVHCGFCTATCPTYQLLGDELDGPRGRIYLIKQVLEGKTPTRKTQQHLDRCLTCRNCESTCPSGVEYGRLVDIGRRIVDERVPRPAAERALRWTLREGLNGAAFAPAMALGKALRGLMPGALRAKVPESRARRPLPEARHARRVLLLPGCVQPAMMPTINDATVRVLDAVGISGLSAPGSVCCGALRQHLSDERGALDQARANIDAWWPYIEPSDEAPVEAIVVNASACGLQIKDYGHLLQGDPRYAERAARVSALARDPLELLPDWLPALRERLGPAPEGLPRLAWHSPCTLQHGQRIRGALEDGLGGLGFEVRLAAAESHLCCGSAGTYSVLQADLSTQLRDRKLTQLQAQPHDVIVSANIGCISHLQAGTGTPVRHWLEVLDEALDARPAHA